MNNIHDLLSYDPLTGIIRWKVSKGNSKSGDQAGVLRKDGYRIIQINGKKYPSGRVAWYLHHGYWPDEVDHEDRNPSNDRLVNLREATHQQNALNRKRTQKSGFKGVYPHGSKWRAMITMKGKTERLGVFNTPEEAHEAYKQRSKSLHKNFGCI